MQSKSMLVRSQLVNKENRSCRILESLWAEAHNLDFSPMVIITYVKSETLCHLDQIIDSFIYEYLSDCFLIFI